MKKPAARNRRCIVTPTTDTRCPRPASKRNGDLFVCSRHGLITMAIIEDWLPAATRRMLAFSRWETVAVGRWLINRLNRREAA